MTRRVWSTAAIVLLSTATSAQRAPSSPLEQPFLLAASLWGSGLVPIGRFTGATWVNTWPEPAESNVPVPAIATVPIAWLGQPVPRQWTLFLRGRVTRVTVTATRRGLETYKRGCTSPAVLAIDRTNAVPTYAYDGGLAIDTLQTVEEARRVEPSDPEWALAEPFVRATFAEHEMRALDPNQDAWFFDELARGQIDLASLPITIESLYRPVTAIAAPIFHVVAVKGFKSARGPMWIAVSGWVRRDEAGTWSATGITARPLTSDPVFNRNIPLGVLHVIARTFWVMYLAQPHSSGFEIYEARGPAMSRVLTSNNGGC